MELDHFLDGYQLCQVRPLVFQLQNVLRRDHYLLIHTGFQYLHTEAHELIQEVHDHLEFFVEVIQLFSSAGQ